MWKTMETKAEEAQVVKTKEGREKRKRGKETRRKRIEKGERKEKKTEKGKNNGSKESSRGVGNLGCEESKKTGTRTFLQVDPCFWKETK